MLTPVTKGAEPRSSNALRAYSGGRSGRNDVFKFTSKCASGGCARVKLDRDGGNHSHYKSTLRKTKPGVYKGTEGPYPYSCLNDANATFTAKHTIRVTKTKNGKATAFSGNSKVTIANCSIATFINYTLKGTLN